MAGISEQEKAKRRRIVGSVIGTHAMEGMNLDARTRSLFDRYAEGELTDDEISSALHEYGMQLVEATRVAGAA